jgi:hypothetical protein
MAVTIRGRVIDPEAYYSAKELQVIVGKSSASLTRWRHLGLGPAYSRAGRSCLYQGKAILTWLQDRTFSSRAAETQRQAAKG